jgi:hypothetical protein
MIRRFRADSANGSGKAMRHLRMGMDKMHLSQSIIDEVLSILAAA